MNLEQFIRTTRWDKVDTTEERYRLLCTDEDCSLSCANISSGHLSITSIHAGERHTVNLDNKSMAFLTLQFLNSLNSKDLDNFCTMFNVFHGKALLSSKNIFSKSVVKS